MFNDAIKISPFKYRLQTVFWEQAHLSNSLLNIIGCFKYFVRQYLLSYMYWLRIFKETLDSPYDKRKYSELKASLQNFKVIDYSH